MAKRQAIQQGKVWGLRGIDPETRNAVRIAARKSGESIGEWCNRVLYEAASRSLKDAPAQSTPQTPAPTLEETLARLAATIERQNARLDAVEAQGVARQGERVSRPENFLMRLYGLLRGKEGHWDRGSV